ncbi:MAG TPA: D-arabinono-1,4-lactone oxidase [Acidimicrobiales bacterium]|nr:D-arabinono-1,4-lactone oxidase [Acidimicrobiales bacterium]
MTTGGVVRRKPAARWSNWAGNQRCAPERVVRPANELELVDAVRSAASAGLAVKAVGAGHSFTDIACTSGVQLHLDRYGQVVSVDRERQRVTVQSGIRIRALSEELAALGLGMPNLGDVGYQSISGAVSTGTHGTGARLRGLAHQVVGLELVTGDGSVVSCSDAEEPELWSAARIGLGALGLLSTVTLQCVPAFNLRAVEKPMRVDDVLSSLDELVDGNDHFEFYWVPHTGWALTKANNRTDEPVGGRGRLREFYEQIVLENIAFGAVCRLGRRRPQWTPRLATAVPGSGSREYVERSDRVFTTPRLVHFYEMEYSIPRAQCANALTQLRQMVEDSGLLISFPVEVRFAAPDDIPLSTGFGRESCYIAVHMYQGLPYDQYFRAVEAIMAPLEGRPHWGKMHFRDASSLAPAYPRWDDFQAARRRLDPAGRFRNAYTDRVLGPLAPA